MVYTKINIHKVDLLAQFKVFEKYAPSEKEFKNVKEHLRLLSIGELTGKPVGETRQDKLLDMFAIFFKNLKKESSDITIEDLRKFKERLINNKILKENGNPYSDETKEDCTETIARYLEWKYPKRVISWKSSGGRTFRKWFVTRPTKKTPEYLSEQEVEKLYNSAKSIDGKFLIAILFDAGCRIEEFLNIRFEDIEYPTNNHPYFRIDLKEEYSKTNGRKISLFWKHSTEAVNKYLSSCEKKDNKDAVFTKNYDSVRMFLSRLGKKTLGKRIYPHILRKSSATYYADKLNRQQLCIRYGWSFSSDMPDIYISRRGMDEEKIKETFLNVDLEIIKRESEGQKKEIEKQDKELKEQKELINLMQKNINLSKKLNKKQYELLLKTLLQSKGITKTEEEKIKLLQNKFN